MKHELSIQTRVWPLREPFVIARGSQTTCEVIVVQLAAGGHVGRGEAVGVDYHGETIDSHARADRRRARQRSSAASIAASCWRSCRPAARAMRSMLRCGISRRSGPAHRCGSWRASRDREAIATCVTIGIRSIAEYEARARAAAPATSGSRSRCRPSARWRRWRPSVARAPNGAPGRRCESGVERGTLQRLAPALASCAWTCWSNRCRESDGDRWRTCELPVPVCADEPANTVEDLPRLIDRYDFVNIKLDKSGGLTAALDFAHAARAAGMRLMVGCMVGGSLAMAPAMVRRAAVRDRRSRRPAAAGGRLAGRRSTIATA